MTPYDKIRAALELADSFDDAYSTSSERDAKNEAMESALAALAELERAAAEPEPVAWMWNDELGIPHASAGSKKPVWLESSASAEYIKQANLRPLYTTPPAPVAEIREPTDDECRNIWREAKANEGDGSKVCAGRAMFDAVRDVMWPKEGL